VPRLPRSFAFISSGPQPLRAGLTYFAPLALGSSSDVAILLRMGLAFSTSFHNYIPELKKNRSRSMMRKKRLM